MAVFALALALRLITVAQVSSSPFFDRPIIDARMYDEEAWRIARGEEPSLDAYYHAPLYSHALAAVYAVFGRSHRAAYVVQCVLGALSCILIFFLARELFGPRVALISGLLAAAYGPFIYYDVQLLRTSLLTLVILLIAWLGIRLTSRSHTISWALFGALIAAGTVTRENVILLLPVAVWWAGRLFPGRLRRLSALGVGFVVVLAPVTLRNALVASDFVLVSYQGGLNLYIGNHPDHDRLTSLQPGVEWQELVDRPRAAGVTRRSQQSSWFLREAARQIASDPIGWLALLGKKALLFVHGAELDPNHSLAHFQEHSSLLRTLIPDRGPPWWPLGFLFPFALLGLARADLRDSRISLTATILLVLSLSVVAGHVRARYRLPVVPFLLVFAVYGLALLQTALRGPIREKLIALGVVVLGALLSNAELVSTSYARRFPLDLYLGEVYRERGELAASERHLRAALTTNPSSPEVLNELGMTLARRGDTTGAIDVLERAHKVAPTWKAAAGNLGTAHLSAGNLANAFASYQLASALDPADEELYQRLAHLAARLPPELALPGLAATIGWAPDRLIPKIKNALCEHYLRVRAWRQVVALAHEVLAVWPTSPSAHLYLARGHVGIGLEQAPRPSGADSPSSASAPVLAHPAGQYRP